MIWIPNVAGPAAEKPLAAHIRAVIEENAGELLRLDAAQVDELAAAVNAYVEGGATPGMYVDSGCLVMLASRALLSVGERGAAHRLLVFGTGLVRPSAWEIRGGEAVWTLDLGRMAVRADTSLELVFFGILNMVLDCMAQVWDATDGLGTLGLRRIEDAAAGVLQGGRARTVGALAQEIRDACGAKLRQVGAARGWRHVPELMRVDL